MRLLAAWPLQRYARSFNSRKLHSKGNPQMSEDLIDVDETGESSQPATEVQDTTRDFIAIALLAAKLRAALATAITDADRLAKLIAVGPDNPTPHHGFRLNEARGALLNATQYLSITAYEMNRTDTFLKGLKSV
jgi:hypothetical protein